LITKLREPCRSAAARRGKSAGRKREIAGYSKPGAIAQDLDRQAMQIERPPV
jgi:hypothetical protein